MGVDDREDVEGSGDEVDAGEIDGSSTVDEPEDEGESDDGEGTTDRALGLEDMVEEELGAVLEGKEPLEAGRGILARGRARIRNCLCLGSRALLMVRRTAQSGDGRPAESPLPVCAEISE